MAYERVNGAWPETIPSITEEEAVRAVKKLYRHFMKKAFRGKVVVTSGRNHTYIPIYRGSMHHKTIRVNPARTWGYTGWKEIVHGLSHSISHLLHPTADPHGMQHAWVEKTMIEHVVASGWLDGKLKRPEKPKPDTKAIRHQRILERIARWEAKQKRAETALRKLRRQQAYYQRQGAPA
jgi:hypothetical protein